MTDPKNYDVIIIGGGQSGLALGYYLRRTALTYIILDASPEPGGAWQQMWPSLRLFSPAQWSSLPGVIMSGGPDYYPTRDQTITYLNDYEKKYQLNVRRPVYVNAVSKAGDAFVLETSVGVYHAKALVNATGSFGQPYIPPVTGIEQFRGEVLHSSRYHSPEVFAGKRVAIVGEGNSGAQILAEVSQVTDTIWVTLKEPSFLPDHIDGRYLFDAASQMYEAKKQGKAYTPPSLGQIVMVPPVVEARSRGVFRQSFRPFSRIEADQLVWPDGHREKVDVIIFCTGFRADLRHLAAIPLPAPDGKPRTDETRSLDIPGMWFVGYGNWTGFASATLIGVGRSAKLTVDELVNYLSRKEEPASYG